MPSLLLDAHYVVDVAVAGRDLVLEPTGREVVEVEVQPVRALRPPDQLVRRGKHAPEILAQRRVANLRRHSLLEERAHRSGVRVGDTEPGRLVVARAGDEGEVRAVR